MKHKKFDFRTAFIDLLLNVLCGMVFLFMIATLLINVQKDTDAGVKKDAQLLANVVWDAALDCDVDVWVEDPEHNVANFQHKDVGLMHIERDDLGFRNDMLDPNTLDPGQKNEETWVLRGRMVGDFTVNVHLYSCRIDGVQLNTGDPVNIPVTVELMQINPKYMTVKKVQLTFNAVWDEETAFTFKMNGDGSLTDFRSQFRTLILGANG